MAMNGTLFVVQVNTGTDVAPVWTTVAGQTGAKVDETTDAIDVSNKDAREGKFTPGRYGSTVSLDGLVDNPVGVGYTALQSAMRDGTLVKLQTMIDSVAVETAQAVVTSLSSDYPDQDSATFSAAFTVSGAWSAAV